MLYEVTCCNDIFLVLSVLFLIAPTIFFAIFTAAWLSTDNILRGLKDTEISVLMSVQIWPLKHCMVSVLLRLFFISVLLLFIRVQCHLLVYFSVAHYGTFTGLWDQHRT